MREFFAKWAIDTAPAPQSGRHGQHGHHPIQKPQKSAILEGEPHVALSDDRGASRATHSVESVAHDAQSAPSQEFPGNDRKALEIKGFVGDVAHVAQDAPLPAYVADLWDAGDWRDWITERAAIIEFDSGVPRAEADRQAFAQAVVEWMNRHPLKANTNICAGCAAPINISGSDWRPLADGASVHYGGTYGLHCLESHGAARRKEAIHALSLMGIRGT